MDKFGGYVVKDPSCHGWDVIPNTSALLGLMNEVSFECLLWNIGNIVLILSLYMRLETVMKEILFMV